MLFRMLLFAALILAVAFTIGCSDKSNNPADTNTPLASGAIGPSGGNLIVPNKITLTIPPGALDTTINFSITLNSSPEAPAGTMGLISPCYTINPEGTTFADDAAIMITYNLTHIGGGHESSAKMYTYGQLGWEELLSVVDTSTNTVVAAIEHLSDFAVLVDTSSPAEGVYVLAVFGRQMTVIPGLDSLMRIDMISARFDSAYAPCEPEQPLRADSVFCNEYRLNWNSSQNGFYYNQLYPMNFLYLDSLYTFRVVGNSSVPSFTKAVRFPASEPYITFPATYDTVSLSGFTATWANSGQGTVWLVMLKDEDTTHLNFETANDGSYTFTAGQLAGFVEGDYGLIMTYANSVAVNSQGYDSRSTVIAKVVSSTVFYLR